MLLQKLIYFFTSMDSDAFGCLWRYLHSAGRHLLSAS